MIRILRAICVGGLLLLGGCATLSQPPILAEDPVGSSVQASLADRLEQADGAIREARLTDAEILYRELTEDHPRLPDVWLRLGNIYVRQSQLSAAERTYRQGLRYRPQDARLWNNLALVQMRQALHTLETSAQVLAADDPHLPRIRRFHDALLQAGSEPDKNLGRHGSDAFAPDTHASQTDAAWVDTDVVNP